MTRIAIDPARSVGRVDRKVFGGFVEHLGRCIYGGLIRGGLAAVRRPRLPQGRARLLRELRLGVLRWLVGSAPNGMARVDPHTPVKPGGRVTFTVDPAHLYFFDPDTGAAITG